MPPNLLRVFPLPIDKSSAHITLGLTLNSSPIELHRSICSCSRLDHPSKNYYWPQISSTRCLILSLVCLDAKVNTKFDALHHRLQETVVVRAKVVDNELRLGVSRCTAGTAGRRRLFPAESRQLVLKSADHSVGVARNAHEIEVDAEQVLQPRFPRR